MQQQMTIKFIHGEQQSLGDLNNFRTDVSAEIVDRTDFDVSKTK